MKQPTDSNLGADVVESSKDWNVKIVAIGDGGKNAVEALFKDGDELMRSAVINTEPKSLRKTRTSEKLCIGTKRTQGLGVGGDPDLARMAAEEELPAIQKLCEGADLVILVSCLGGGTSSGISPVAARAAKEAGARVLAVVTLPFNCEGTRRRNQAHSGLQRLRMSADGVLCVSNERMLKLVSQEMGVMEAFALANETMAKMIRCFGHMFTHPGLIKISFSDFCSVLRGRVLETSFATAEATGDNASKDALEALLASPCLQSGEALTQADGILVSIIGGRSMTIAQVDWIMTEMQKRSGHAQVALGTAIQEGFEKRLAISVFVCRRDSSSMTGDGPVPNETAVGEDDFGVSRLLINKDPEPAPKTGPRTGSRFAPPAPPLTPERRQQILSQQKRSSPRSGKPGSPSRQGQLPLDIISKGRFDKSEPTIHEGEDLDIPTYIRRGILLN